MTPNETMIVQSCVNQTKLFISVSSELMKLVQVQLSRELGTSKMSTEEYKKYIVEVMDFVIPIFDSLKKE